MGSTCLSLVPVLRCIGLTRLESGLLLIPAGLELIFSLGLIVAGRGQGRRRYLLAAEGIVYMFLAVLDVLTHEIPMFSSSLSSFRNLDIFIGAASFLPVALFTGFLYLFKRTEFFPYFPRRFVFVAHTFALVVIPVLLATNEVGSFIGNSYTVVQFPTGPFGAFTSPQFAVGTQNDGAETARVFFNSLSLALMALYSVVTFLVFFVRLAGSFVQQREIEDKGGMQEETYLFKGTGWVALGMALSAAEAFVGFADGDFGIFLTRRILRMISRACVIIGIVKGPDRHLRFEMMDSEKDTKRLKRKSTLRLQIGNPMFVSSTARLSNLPAVDLAPPRSASMLSATAVGTAPFMGGGGQVQFPSHPRPLSQHRPGPKPVDGASIDTTRRVTVSLGGRNRAPTLILRLSDTNLPSPSIFMPPRGRRSNRSSNASNHYSLRDDPEAFARFQAQREAEQSLASPGFAYTPGQRPQTYTPGAAQRPGSLLCSHWSSSGNGVDPPSPHRAGIRDSLRRASALFGRLARFPLPPREQQRTSYQGPPPAPSSLARSSGEDGLMRRSSSRRKPPPPVRASMFDDASDLLDRGNFVSPATPGDEYPAIPDSAGLRRVPESSREDVASIVSPDESITSGQWIAAYPRTRTITAPTSLMPPPRSEELLDAERDPQSLDPANASGGSELPGPLSAAVNEHAANMDWLSNPDLANDVPDTAFQAARAHARTSSQAMPSILTRAVRPPSANVSQSSPVTPRPGGARARQLSFGSVLRRTTPEPSSTPVRGSIAPEHDNIDNWREEGVSDTDSDIIDFGRLQPTQEEEDASRRAVEDAFVARSPTGSLSRSDSSVLPREDEARRKRASQLM